MKQKYNIVLLMLPVIYSTIFFAAAFLTLGAYGPSWDETIHFRRGQAYLQYFLTGEKTYVKLPKIDLQGTGGDPNIITYPRRSFYQNDTQNGEYFLNKDIGHPPLNGEIAAFFNYVFYQKLGVMDDLSSHHLFNILASALLVFTAVFFIQRYFGLFPGLVSFLTISTYPLFWAESHFNIKDPVQASFFSTTLLLLIISLEKKNSLWLIPTAVFFLLSLGAKFNILFLPLIILPYVLINYRHLIIKPTKNHLFALLAAPLAISIFFILSWPYLWQDIVNRLGLILTFYKEIGIGAKYQPDSFFILGFNTYPIQWILYTTPPLVLGLTTVGIISSWINRRVYKGITCFWLLWMVIPILRVTIPGTNIYGGIRQIFEFLPAMAIISGLGAWQIIDWIKARSRVAIFVKILIVGMFLWPLVILVKLHPYQSVYFNSLIGGLHGASQINFPSWGNSLGSAYKGGIEWINANVDKGSKLTLIQGTSSNVPPMFLRKDIKYLVGGEIDAKSTYFSGIQRNGEYIMELIFNDTGKDFFYAWDYVENFLLPVYELKVDNVAILKIWKNDLEHTTRRFRLPEISYNGDLDVTTRDNEMMLSIGDIVNATRLVVLFENDNCVINQSGFIETSTDGKVWKRERDIFPQYQIYRKLNLTNSELEYFFAARQLRYIKLITSDNAACILNNPKVKIFII